MSWVISEVTAGGLLAVQPQHIVAIYDEQGVVKLSTSAYRVHVLKDTTVQRSARRLTSVAEDEATASV